MEQDQPVEQAADQSSAAPTPQDSAPDFGSVYLQHVLSNPRSGLPRRGGDDEAPQSGASSGPSGASAEVPPPAGDASQDATPPPAATAPATPPSAGDATPPPSDTPIEGEPEQPKKLSRRERRAQRLAAQQAQDSSQPSAGAPVAPSVDDDEDDDILDRLDALSAQVEKIAPPAVSRTLEQTEAQAASAREYETIFGSPQEFGRRSDAKIRNDGSLTVVEDEELEIWAKNRIAAQAHERMIQGNISQILLATAQQHGVDPQVVSAAPSLSAALAGLIAGSSKSDIASVAEQRAATAEAKLTEMQAQVRTLTENNDRLKETNQQLADANEALERRAPAQLRQPVAGGLSSLSALGETVDPKRQNGRQMLQIALANRARQQNGAVAPALRNGRG